MQVDPERPVLVAGDPERFHECNVKKDGGIWYHDAVIQAVVSIKQGGTWGGIGQICWQKFHHIWCYTAQMASYSMVSSK